MNGGDAIRDDAAGLDSAAGPGALRLGPRVEVAVALLLALIGLAAAYQGWQYGTGSLRRLGPGLFPMWIGLALAALALVAAFGAWRGADEPITFELRGLAWMALGLVAFAALVERTGLLAATAAMVAAVGLAGGAIRPLRDAGVALGLSLFGYLLFGQLLGIPLALVRGLL